MWDEEAQQQTRTNFERYPELLEGEDEVDWLNFEALNKQLVAMIDMCGSALRNKKDKTSLKDWLSTVTRDIKASREKEDCTCGRDADESMGCTCRDVAKPNERERALAQLTLLQILGALDCEVGLMLSSDRNFQALLCSCEHRTRLLPLHGMAAKSLFRPTFRSNSRLRRHTSTRLRAVDTCALYSVVSDQVNNLAPIRASTRASCSTHTRPSAPGRGGPCQRTRKRAVAPWPRSRSAAPLAEPPFGEARS